MKGEQEKSDRRCAALLADRRTAEELTYRIGQKRDRVAIIKRLLVERRIKLAGVTEQRDKLLRANRETQKKFPQYESNVKILREYVDRRLDNNEQLMETRRALQQELKFRVRHNIDTLTRFIFPLSTLVSKQQQQQQQHQHEHSSGSVQQNIAGIDTVSELAEATQTAYIRGRWVYQDGQNTSEVQHVIVAPSLPGDGDYSAYNDWVATTKDGVTMQNVGMTGGGGGATVAASAGGPADASNNLAYRISAALTYTAQFTNLLSFYLDVRLPNKIIYG